MYKVFFNDRIILLTDQPGTFLKEVRLIHRFTSMTELEKSVFGFLRLNSQQKLLIHHHDIEVLLANFVRLFVYVEAAGGLVRNADSDILVIKRKGKWDLPKGKLDKGETNEEAALREVSEECGIQGQIIVRTLSPTFHVYCEDSIWHLKKTQWFEMSYMGHEIPVPQKSEQITDVRWISQKDLTTITDETFRSLLEIFRLA